MFVTVFQRSLVHFWRRRHDPGILFLFFDELFHTDDAAVGGGAVRRIAEFVGAGHGGLHVSDDLLQVSRAFSIHANCWSFCEMLEHEGEKKNLLNFEINRMLWFRRYSPGL